MADAVEQRFFVQEHREMKSGLARFAKVAEQAERFPVQELAHSLNDLLRWLDNSFLPHAAWEEEWLYPRLEGLTGSPWPTRLLGFDHHQIRERIEALRGDRDAVTSGPAPARPRTLAGHLYALEALILAHMEREDRFLIPLLDESSEVGIPVGAPAGQG